MWTAHQPPSRVTSMSKLGIGPFSKVDLVFTLISTRSATRRFKVTVPGSRNVAKDVFRSRAVLLGDRRVQLEVAHHQLLERGSPLGVRRRCSKRLDHLVHRSHARRPYCPTRTSTGRIGPPVAAIRLACWARTAN